MVGMNGIEITEDLVTVENEAMMQLIEKAMMTDECDVRDKYDVIKELLNMVRSSRRIRAHQSR